MSALVVDTSSWVSYFAGGGRPALIDDALAEGRAHVPLVVVAELCSGALSAKNRTALEDLLRDLPVTGADIDHWYRVGQLRARLRRQGLTLSTPDAHVAQTAIDLDGSLLTEDAVFTKVPGLRLAATV